jgi:hypothetical protein
MRFALPFAALLVLIPMTAPMAAEDDEALGRFRDWYAVAYVDGGKKICYMVTQPTKSEGDYSQRGPAYVQVTRREGDSVPDVVSVEAGYPYKDASEVEVSVDGKSHTLFSDGQTAWAYDETGDKAMVKAMAKGSKMVIKGVSSRGTPTTDTYSLMGFVAARRAITQACGK